MQLIWIDWCTKMPLNLFVINGYQFIRLYLLDKFKNNLEFPIRIS